MFVVRRWHEEYGLESWLSRVNVDYCERDILAFLRSGDDDVVFTTHRAAAHLFEEADAIACVLLLEGTWATATQVLQVVPA